jgi:WD40 repeat protein
VGHTAPVWCLAVSPNGRFLASGGDDRKVRIWEAESGKVLQVLGGRPWSVRHLAFSPDSRHLFVAPGTPAPGAPGVPGTTAELWRVGQWDQPLPLDFASDGGGLLACAFSADGGTLRILAGYRPRCFVWDVRTGKPTRTHRDLSLLK